MPRSHAASHAWYCTALTIPKRILAPKILLSAPENLSGESFRPSVSAKDRESVYFVTDSKWSLNYRAPPLIGGNLTALR